MSLDAGIYIREIENYGFQSRFALTPLALCIYLVLSVNSPPNVAASDSVSKKEDHYRAVQKYQAKGETFRQVLTPRGPLCHGVQSRGGHVVATPVDPSGYC